MADNFNMKQFLMENKLGAYSRLKEEKQEMNESFKYFDNYQDFEDTLFQLYPQVKANPEKYKKDGLDGEVRYSDGYVNWASWNPNRPKSPSGLPPGAVNMDNKMSQSDLIYPAGSRMDETDEKEETKEDIGGDIGDAQAEKMMDFLAEKDKVKEALTPEMFERMDALTSTHAQIAMIKAAEIMMNELTKEGFEVLDIREYFTQLIANDI